MSLYVRVNCNFFSHRKTAKLRSLIGDDAFWLPPRWWAYAAENQPDGIFKDYTGPELATLLGYTKDAAKMLDALLQAGFADLDPLRIHDWADFNAFHLVFSQRAKNAATARWQKEKGVKEKDKRGEEKSQAVLQASAPESSGTTTAQWPSLPTLLPIKRDLWTREYDTLESDAKQLLKKTRERFVEKRLTKEACSLIVWLEKNEPPATREQKIQATKADPKNFSLKLTVEGQAHEKLWLDRLEEIRAAKRGEIKK